MRIVSLVPSLSEMICEFGLQEQLVACTQFCVRPVDLHRHAKLIGGTKNPDIQAIAALNPTHIFVNEEENKPEHIRACQSIAPTFVSFPKSPEDVPNLLRQSGIFLNVQAIGERHAQLVEDALAQLHRASRTQKRRYVYLIWRKPYMVAAKDTYISAMLGLLGWENTVDSDERYPTLGVQDMATLKADLILMSTEPYPFRKRDQNRLQQEWRDFLNAEAPEILKADGQRLSWYGTLTSTALQHLLAWEKDLESDIIRKF